MYKGSNLQKYIKILTFSFDDQNIICTKVAENT